MVVHSKGEIYFAGNYFEGCVGVSALKAVDKQLKAYVVQDASCLMTKDTTAAGDSAVKKDFDDAASKISSSTAVAAMHASLSQHQVHMVDTEQVIKHEVTRHVKAQKRW